MQHQIPYAEHHIYKTPPPRALLEQAAKGLAGGAKELIAFRGRAAKDLGLSPDAPGDTDYLGLIDRHPRLLRRPITVHAGRAVVGFKEAEFKRLFEL